MTSDGDDIQGYNGHLAVDSDHQVIVALGVSNQTPDVEHLQLMVKRTAATAGALPAVMTVYTGYWSESNAELCAEQGIDASIATGRLPHGQTSPPKRGPISRDTDAKARMARKLRSKAGSGVRAQSKAIVVPVNGSIKEARRLLRFLLREMEKGGCVMAPDRRDSQSAQIIVQIRAIKAAGSGTSKRIKGSCPGGDGHQH